MAGGRPRRTPRARAASSPSRVPALRRVLGGCQLPAHSVVAFGVAQATAAYPHGHARLRAGTRHAVELRGIVVHWWFRQLLQLPALAIGGLGDRLPLIGADRGTGGGRR